MGFLLVLFRQVNGMIREKITPSQERSNRQYIV